MLSQNGIDGGDTMKSVTFPKYYFLSVGSLCAPVVAAFFAIVYIYRDGTEPLAAHIIFTILVLSGTALVLYAFVVLYGLLWDVRYNDRLFIHRSVFGHKTTVYYSDIRSIKRTNCNVFIYDQNKRYSVSLNADGANAFMETLSRQANVRAL